MDIKQLLELNDLAKKEVLVYPKKRFVYKKLTQDKTRTFVGITGLRGTGKTVLLRQLLREKKGSFYISLDTVEILDLFETVKSLHQEFGFKTFFLDEVHYFPKWAQALKKIYDFLPVKIYFSSSIFLDIIGTPADLSRRVRIFKIYPFSFREYLYFKKNVLTPSFSLSKLRDFKKFYLEIHQYEKLFEDYLQFCLPAMLEDDSIDIVANILEKILSRDLVFAGEFKGEDIVNAKALLRFTAQVLPEGLSYSVLAKNLKITKYKAISYVDVLVKAFVLNIVMPHGSEITREPKIFLEPPFRFLFKENLPQAWLKGAMREDFAASSLIRAKLPLFYLKGKRGQKTPDFIIKKEKKPIVLEIGGRKKSWSQFKGLDKKFQKYILSFPAEFKPNKIPLIVLGFLD